MVIKRILSRFSSRSLNLIGLATLLLLIWGTIAPVGTLVWWLALESEDLNVDTDQPPDGLLSDDDLNSDAALEPLCYIIFLPGVGNTGSGSLPPGETEFLNRLIASHPDCVAVDDVFPYSLRQQSLVEDRPLADFWESAQEAEGWLGQVLINIRNFWQMALSADDRYGPTYNWGIAAAVVDRINAKQPIRNQQQPLELILIGTSGGAQVAVGSTPYLDRWLNANITIISIGGFFEGTEGFAEAQRIYHLQGKQDYIAPIANVVFPARWRWTVGSPFNQARRKKKYVELISGPHEHQGDQGYFGTEQMPEQTQRYLDVTLEKVKQLPVWVSLPASNLESRSSKANRGGIQ